MFCYLSKDLSRCMFSEHEETEKTKSMKIMREKIQALKAKDSEINISL